VELLVLNGVDPNVKTEGGETMLGMPASCLHCTDIKHRGSDAFSALTLLVG